MSSDNTGKRVDVCARGFCEETLRVTRYVVVISLVVYEVINDFAFRGIPLFVVTLMTSAENRIGYVNEFNDCTLSTVYYGCKFVKDSVCV